MHYYPIYGRRVFWIAHQPPGQSAISFFIFIFFKQQISFFVFYQASCA